MLKELTMLFSIAAMEKILLTNAEVMNNWLKLSLILMTGRIHVFRIFWMVMMKKNFRRIMDVL